MAPSAGHLFDTDFLPDSDHPCVRIKYTAATDNNPLAFATLHNENQFQTIFTTAITARMFMAEDMTLSAGGAVQVLLAVIIADKWSGL